MSIGISKHLMSIKVSERGNELEVLASIRVRNHREGIQFHGETFSSRTWNQIRHSSIINQQSHTNLIGSISDRLNSTHVSQTESLQAISRSNWRIDRRLNPSLTTNGTSGPEVRTAGCISTTSDDRSPTTSSSSLNHTIVQRTEFSLRRIGSQMSTASVWCWHLPSLQECCINRDWSSSSSWIGDWASGCRTVGLVDWHLETNGWRWGSRWSSGSRSGHTGCVRRSSCDGDT